MPRFGCLALLFLVVPLPWQSTLIASTPPAFSIAGVTVHEGDGKAILTITKSAKANSYSKITVTTADGTAKAGSDYQAVNTTITFANSQLSAQVSVPIINDAVSEPTEAFSVRLAAARFAAVPATPATVTILDDDPQPSTGWTKCADENGTCNVPSGTVDVRYGADTTYFTKTVTGPLALGCNNTVFGDPIYGTVKHCDLSAAAPAPTPTPTPTPAPTPPNSGYAPTGPGWVIANSACAPVASSGAYGAGGSAPLVAGKHYRLLSTPPADPSPYNANPMPGLSYVDSACLAPTQ